MSSFAYTYLEPVEQRLDTLITRFLQDNPLAHGITRSQVKQWIKAGQLTINGKPVQKAGAIVKQGDVIELHLDLEPRTHHAPFNFPLNILFEDPHLIVINKPAKLTMHPGAGNRDTTLVNALTQHFGESTTAISRAGIVHRLDKDTTGVVVVAKTVQAHSHLSAQFARRSVGRAYYALVFCTPRSRRVVNQQDSGVVRINITRHRSQRIKMAVSEREGKSAATHWKVMERMPYGCLLEVRLETGRTHQIRVHMDHIGSPVIGDRTYGDFSGLPTPLKRVAQTFGRQALHACLLEFTHPVSAKRLTFTSNLPEDFSELIEQFRRYTV